MLDNKTTTDCRNKRIKEAKIRSFLKSVVVCFVRHLTDHYKIREETLIFKAILFISSEMAYSVE